MTIGIDVRIDPSGAVSGGRTAEASLDRVGKAADKTSTSVKKFNGFIGQAGFQISDVATQISMGANAFGVLGVQGGQLLGFLSPLAGALATVAGITAAQLTGGMYGAAEGTDALEEAIVTLNKTVKVSSDGVVTFTEDIERLATTNEKAARTQIALAVNQTVDALNAANDVVSESISELDGWTNNLTSASRSLNILDETLARTGMTTEQLLTETDLYGTGLTQLAGYVEDLAEEFDLTTDQAVSLARSFSAFEQQKTPENLQKITDAVNAINEANGFTNRSFVELAQTINEGNLTASQYTTVMTLLKEAMGDLDGIIKPNTESFRSQQNVLDSLSKNIAVLQLQTEGYNREAAILNAVLRSGVDANSQYGKQIALLAGQQFDLQQQLKSTNVEVEAYDKDGAYLNKLKNQVQLVSLSAREQALLRAEFGLSSDATQEQIDQAREYAATVFDTRVEKQKQTTAEREYQQAVQGLLPDLDEYALRSDILQQAHAAGIITTQQLSLEMTKLRESSNIGELSFAESFNAEFQSALGAAQNFEASFGKITANTFGTFSQEVGNAATDMLLFGATGEEAMQRVAQAVVGQLISSLVQLGVQWAVNAAIGQGIATASLAATAATASATTAAWAPAAALASLATLGSNSAPALAAVTGTVASTQAIAASSAAIPGFAEGGFVHGAGTGTSDSITAKLSAGEFVMPARETSRHAPELNAMRSGTYSGGRGAPAITIINQTTGRIDSAEAKYVTRDELVLTIREEVPAIVEGEIGNEYSRTNKVLQGQYSMTRNL